MWRQQQQQQQSLTRVTKSYLPALGTTQISSYFTKHWTKFLTHQTGNYPVTCFVSKPSRITLVELSSTRVTKSYLLALETTQISTTSLGCSRRIRLRWVGFLVVCFLHKINPNPRKMVLLWGIQKWLKRHNLTYFFLGVGLALGWGICRFHNNFHAFSNET